MKTFSNEREMKITTFLSTTTFESKNKRLVITKPYAAYALLIAATNLCRYYSDHMCAS